MTDDRSARITEHAARTEREADITREIPTPRVIDLNSPAILLELQSRPWMGVALAEYGVREYTARQPGPAGELSNSRVELYQRTVGQMRTDDEIAWCASFIGFCLERAGYPHLGTGARAYAHFGDALNRPVIGCLAPMWRGVRLGTKGHVNLFLGLGPCEVRLQVAGRLVVVSANVGEFVGLGGNQGDVVCAHPYDTERVLGWRMPRR